jgi:hypothetical protein
MASSILSRWRQRMRVVRIVLERAWACEPTARDQQAAAGDHSMTHVAISPSRQQNIRMIRYGTSGPERDGRQAPSVVAHALRYCGDS